MRNEFDKLKEFCDQGIERLGLLEDKAIKEQYSKELEAIEKHGYEKHYYYMACMLREARKHGSYIYFRGCVSGSIVNYLSGISDINPLEYGLDVRYYAGFDGEKEPSFDVNIDDAGLGIMVDTIKAIIPEDRLIIHTSEVGTRMLILPEDYKRAQAAKFRKKFVGTPSEPDAFHLVYEYEEVEPELIQYLIFDMPEANMLADLALHTGINPESIDVNDEKVLSMYSSAAALGINDSGIWDIRNGMCGILEKSRVFDYIISKTCPKTLEEVNIAYCLAHGSGVWLDNGELLLGEGKKLSEILAYREAVYAYLVKAEIESRRAFEIMNFIRMGKASRPHHKDKWESYKAELIDKVEPWFIESVEKIQYMFPKAHSLSYVLTDMRLAWYKINYPREFYNSYLHTHDMKLMESTEIMEAIASIDAINKWIYWHLDYDKHVDKKLEFMQIMYERLARGIDI